MQRRPRSSNRTLAHLKFTGGSMKLISAFFAGSVLLVWSCLSFAQSPVEPLKLGSVTVHGSIRTRVYGWDWFRDPPYENSYAYPGTLIRLSFSQQRGAFDWNFELGAPVILACRTMPSRRRRRASWVWAPPILPPTTIRKTRPWYSRNRHTSVSNTSVAAQDRACRWAVSNSLMA